MSDLCTKVPETLGSLTNEEVRANQEPASKETDSVSNEQSAPREPTNQNHEPEPTTEHAEKDSSSEVDARTAANRANSLKSTGLSLIHI